MTARARPQYEEAMFSSDNQSSNPIMPTPFPRSRNLSMKCQTVPVMINSMCFLSFSVRVLCYPSLRDASFVRTTPQIISCLKAQPNQQFSTTNIRSHQISQCKLAAVSLPDG